MARLITAAEKNVKDPQGWAADLLDVMRLHNLPASKENICAAIAIIDQESSFVADPAVAGLGKISETALRAKMDKVPVLGRVALHFLEIKPSPSDNYLARIRSARTEHDLDLVYRAMVADAAKQSGLGLVINSGLLNKQIDGRNEIDTIGSMQVSVDFALEVAKRRRWLPMSLDDVYALRDELYTRHGGMYYGVLLLLGYETGYNRKLYRFADFQRWPLFKPQCGISRPDCRVERECDWRPMATCCSMINQGKWAVASAKRKRLCAPYSRVPVSN